MKRKQGLPTYTRTPEPLWDYSWFHPLLKIFNKICHCSLSFTLPYIKRIEGESYRQFCQALLKYNGR